MTTGLGGTGVQLHSHASTHIPYSNTGVVSCTPKTLHGYAFPSVSDSLITLFTLSLVRPSARLQSLPASQQ